MKELAEQAGVSLATVSRVLSNYRWVSDETRELVMDAIARTGYVPYPALYTVPEEAQQLVAVIVPTMDNTFFTQFVGRVTQELQKQGYYAMVFSAEGEEKAEMRFLSGPVCASTKGIITITSIETPHYFRSITKPMIVVDRNFSESVVDSVMNDNFSVVYYAAKRMIQAGHRSIALLMGDVGFGLVDDKHNGYVQALTDHQIRLREEYILKGDWSRQSGVAQMEQLLALSEPPTAVIACNNALSMGAMDSLAAHGLKAGRDISLIGFEESDPDQYFFTREEISTVRLDTNRLATYTVETILEKIQQKQEKQKNVIHKSVMEMAYIERGSVISPRSMGL